MQFSTECAWGVSQIFPSDSTCWKWSKEATVIHPWIEMVVIEMLPFSFCDKHVMGKYFSVGTISVPTLRKYTQNIGKMGEEKMAWLVCDKIALVVDGWPSGDFHYFSSFGIFPYENTGGYCRCLLRFSTVEHEWNMHADEHIQFSYFCFTCLRNLLALSSPWSVTILQRAKQLKQKLQSLQLAARATN